MRLSRYLVIILPMMGLSWVKSGFAQDYESLRHPLIAQTGGSSDRNRDRFPQPSSTPSPLPPETEAPTVDRSPMTPIPSSGDSSPTILVNSVTVTNSSIFQQSDLQAIIEPLQGKNVTKSQLIAAADQITQLYLQQGYLTSRAVLVEDTLNTGNIEIRAIEGELEAIEIEGTKRVKPSYIRDRIALGAKIPLNAASLENQLLLLKNDPLLKNIEASLKAGTGIGQSILVVRVTEADFFHGNVRVDNYSPPSVGSERYGIDLLHRNLTGRGDQISGSYEVTSRGGSEEIDLAYAIPINAMNGTIQLRTTLNNNKVIQEPFDEFDIEGESELYEISYRQPIIRSPREELALSLGFTFQDATTYLGDQEFGFSIGTEDGSSRTSVFKLGQEYIRRDGSGAWALRSLFSFGADIFDATVNDAPIPDGLFFAWLSQIQRVQVLNKNNILIIQGDLQLTPNSLLPSQQFVIGGGQSVRGYRQNVRAGDNGFRFSLENRTILARNEAGESKLQIAPFLDMGSVWNSEDNPNFLPDQNFIIGLGVGLILQPINNLTLRVDYAPPLIDLRDRGSNAQDDGFYFSVNYGF